MLASGKEGGDTVVLRECPRHREMLPEGLKVHPLVGGVLKQIPPVKQQLDAGVIGHAAADAVGGDEVLPQLRHRPGEEPVPIEGDLGQGPVEGLPQFVQPRHIHADQIVPAAGGGLDHIVHVPQGGKDRHLQTDARGLLQVREQAVQGGGGGRGHRQHPQGLFPQADLRDRQAAEAVVFQAEKAGHGLVVFQPGGEQLDDLVGQPLIVQLIDRRVRVCHRRLGGDCDDLGQRLLAGVGAGSADRGLPPPVRADDGIVALSVVEELKGPQPHLVVPAAHEGGDGLASEGGPESPEEQRRVRGVLGLRKNADTGRAPRADTGGDLPAGLLRVKARVHHVGICGAFPLKKDQGQLRRLGAVVGDGVRQTGPGDDGADPFVQCLQQKGGLAALHGPCREELYGVAPLDELPLKHLVHGRAVGRFDPWQQDRDGAVLSLAEALGLGVDLVAQLLRRLPHQADLLDTDVPPAVDDIGDRSVGDAGLPCDILDRGHPAAPLHLLDVG